VTDTTQSIFDHGPSDQQALIIFVSTLEADLRTVLFPSGESHSPIAAEEMAGLARDAFEPGVVRQFEDLRTQLTERWAEHQDGLERHGLLGPQLRFKLAVNELGRNRYVEAVSGGNQPPWGWRNALERYLVAADVILDSLSAALGGVGAAIGEFKKMIEWLLADTWKRGWPA
jgi:hypothetical protein